MKKILFALFLSVCAVQLAVPASMIIGREQTLSRGEVYRFGSAPIDPYDPFKGRYVALRLDSTVAPVTEGQNIAAGESVYALLTRDTQEFARFSGVSRNRPTEGDYLKVRVRYSGPLHVGLILPFERYYAEEDTAPNIEWAYLSTRRNTRRDTYITVRVYKGQGVLEELYIEGLPITDYLEKEAAEKRQP